MSNQMFSNFLKSEVENTFTEDCLFSLGSLDQIGQFSFKESAKNIESFLSGEIFSDFSLNSSKKNLGLISTKEFREEIIDSNSSSFSSLEYLNRTGLFFLSSSMACSGENNSNLKNSELIIMDLTGLSLKKETKIFVSTTIFTYQPSSLYLFHIPSLTFSPNLKQSSSVSSEFSNILSNFLSNRCLFALSSTSSLASSDQLIQGSSFIIDFKSS